jgi:hypothetical protein
MAPKRARPVASVEEIDGRDEAPDEDEQALVSDGERTVSDIPVPIEIEGIVAESSAQRTKDFPQEVRVRRAGLLLKSIRTLTNDASRRAALPLPATLEGKVAWTAKRLRSLAIICELDPAKGLMRGPLLNLLNGFRGEPVELDQDEAQLQRVTLDASQDDLPSDGEDEVARLRALEESELLAMMEKEEQKAEGASAERKRVEAEMELAAVHDAKMKALRERFSAVKRTTARSPPRRAPTPPRPLAPPFPLLTVSRLARMNKRLPRPAVRPSRPEGLQTTASPPDVGGPELEEAGSDLAVRISPVSLCACVHILSLFLGDGVPKFGVNYARPHVLRLALFLLVFLAPSVRRLSFCL